MTDTVRELDDASLGRWDAFVQECPDASFFHRAGWKKVIADSFGQKPVYHYAERDGAIVGVLPLVHVRSRIFGNRLVANAFCVDGAPAAVDDAAYAALDAKAEELLAALDAEYIEYRNPRRLHPDWGRKDELYSTFDRPIEPAEADTLKQIPRKQRAVVRKALESDLTVTVDADAGDFYALYSLGMRNLGTPVFSRRYIDNLMTVFAGDIDIVTVRQGGKPLSSVLNFYFRDRVMPYYTGADPAARRTGAADLMYFKVMRRAIERGYTHFDFGRSKAGTGPFAFKKNWGFEPQPLIHEFKMKGGAPLPDVNPNNPKYALMIRTWQKLPLPLANIIGPWVSRDVG